MEKILIVSESEKGRAGLEKVLRDLGYTDLLTASDADDAQAAVRSTECSIAVINAPFAGDDGEALCRFMVDNTYACVLLLVREEQRADMEMRLEQIGVIVLGKPLQLPLFGRVLRLAGAVRQRLLGLKSENVQLLHKIDELRLVDRAKCVLIQYLGVGEKQAHRYIEKQAMDRRLSKEEIAREILKTYEM